MLESFCHSDAVFITLTYADEYLPENGALDKRDLQLFLKRLRKRLAPRSFRYYACGEYGSKTMRPHYHAILFGVSEIDQDDIAKSWIDPKTGILKGRVHVGFFSRESAQYVAGYVTKKLGKVPDGFQKEFSLMSLKPGIGYPALPNITKLLEDERFRKYLNLKGDVPTTLRHGGKQWPFGRYLTEKLRLMMDVNHDISAYLVEVQKKWLEAREAGKLLKEHILDESEQQIKQTEKRFKIFTQRDKI